MINVYEIVIDLDQVNDYIRGRISGMIYILTRKLDMTYPWKSKETDSRWIVNTICSDDIFKEIIETIEHVYPGVIVESRQVG